MYGNQYQYRYVLTVLLYRLSTTIWDLEQDVPPRHLHKLQHTQHTHGTQCVPSAC